MKEGWLLSQLGCGFIVFAIGADAPEELTAHGLVIPCLRLEPTPELAARYLGEAKGAIYLIRPDQHVAARWDRFDQTAVAAALGRAIGKE
jgi:3-(3-hydroxy-phenyl)propionate hydroxylase